MRKITNSLTGLQTTSESESLIGDEYLAINIFTQSGELMNIIYFTSEADVKSIAKQVLAAKSDDERKLKTRDYFYKLTIKYGDWQDYLLHSIIASRYFVEQLMIKRGDLIDSLMITRPEPDELLLIADVVVESRNKLLLEGLANDAN